MDDIDKFIESVESICARRSMYVCDGSFLEVCAYLSGYARASGDCPLSNDGFIAFCRYVARHFGFPENYGWPYVLKVCSRNDDEAVERLRSLLVDFSNACRTLSYEQILESVRPRVLRQENAEPEQTMRRLQTALLTCRRDEIEPLILEHPNADILWSGAYERDVVPLLKQIFDSNPIGRISGDVDDGEVKLLTAEFPFPMTVKKVGEHWKVDAGDIIKSRKRSQELADEYDGRVARP